MRIDKSWLQEGQYLGLQFLVADVPTVVWFLVQGREFADYHYSFGSIAANTASGWIDLQTSSNAFILEPRDSRIIHHMFVGMMPSDAIMFVQYPQGADHNSLVGTRAVDANAQGGIRGIESLYNAPSPRTELISVREARPLLNMFNDNENSQTVRIHLWSYKYLVGGPKLSSDLGGSDRMQQLVEEGKARMYTIYGTVPITAPEWIDTAVRDRVQASAASLSRRNMM